MLLELIEDEHIKETRITIACRERDADIEKLIAYLEHMDDARNSLLASAEGKRYHLNISTVLYIEAVDRRTFCYTQDHEYELDLRLYEIEEKYQALDFMRISKSCIVNLYKIHSLKPDFGGKILATMENGEKLYISRQYAPMLKEKLGIGGRRL